MKTKLWIVPFLLSALVCWSAPPISFNPDNSVNPSNIFVDNIESPDGSIIVTKGPKSKIRLQAVGGGTNSPTGASVTNLVKDSTNGVRADLMAQIDLRTTNVAINAALPPFNVPRNGTDATPAIQLILDTANSNAYRRTIYFPAGRYTINGTLRVWPMTTILGDGSSIGGSIGAGKAITEFVKWDDAASPMFILTNNCTFKDIRFYSQGTNSDCMIATNAHVEGGVGDPRDLHFENCNFTGWRYPAMLRSAYFVKFYGCTFYDFDIGVYTLGIVNALSVRDCVFTFGTNGIVADLADTNDYAGYEWNIVGTAFEQNIGYGFVTRQRIKTINFLNNNFEYNRKGSILLTNAEAVAISNNKFMTTTNTHVDLHGCDGVTLFGNYFDVWGGRAHAYDHTYNVTKAGNNYGGASALPGANAFESTKIFEVLASANTASLVVITNGNVGVGVEQPAASLHVDNKVLAGTVEAGTVMANTITKATNPPVKLLAWYRQSTITNSAYWFDSSGNGKHLVQFESWPTPTVSSNSLNGMNTFLFGNLTNAMLRRGAWEIHGPVTFILKLRQHPHFGSGYYRYIFSDSGPFVRFSQSPDADNLLSFETFDGGFHASGFAHTTKLATNTWGVVTIQMGAVGSTNVMWVNGVRAETYSLPNACSNYMSDFQLGSQLSSGSAHFEISDLMIVPGLISSNQDYAVRMFLDVTNDLTVNGNLTISGSLNVGSQINGNGTGITNLNASNIASGTLPDAQLGTNVAKKDWVTGYYMPYTWLGARFGALSMSAGDIPYYDGENLVTRPYATLPSGAEGDMLTYTNSAWRTLPKGSSGQVIKANASGYPIWGADATGEAGGGITSLNALTGTTQTISTGPLLSVTSTGTDHKIALSEEATNKINNAASTSDLNGASNVLNTAISAKADTTTLNTSTNAIAEGARSELNTSSNELKAAISAKADATSLGNYMPTLVTNFAYSGTFTLPVSCNVAGEITNSMTGNITVTLNNVTNGAWFSLVVWADSSQRQVSFLVPENYSMKVVTNAVTSNRTNFIVSASGGTQISGTVRQNTITFAAGALQ